MFFSRGVDNFLRILFVLLLIAASVFVFFHPKKTVTNILKAILSKSEKDTLIVDLSKKQSGKINVVFESTDMDAPAELKEKFFDSLDKKSFYTNEVNFDNILGTYKKYQNNLLSNNTAELLKNGNYDTVVQESLERLYNPVGVTLAPLQEDPFLLLDDFVQSLSAGGNADKDNNENETEQAARGDGSQKHADKYYETAEFYVNKDIALSPSLLNIEMKKLVDTQKSMSGENTRIYLSGAPVHTYFASSKSIKEINLICLLSSLFVILICKFYFKSFKILLPVALSLGLGMYAGFLVTSMFFDSIHILTFVFASTLIGICVDYSLHYFAHNKDLKLILNSLTQSLLTTVCAFLVLLLSKIELLRQISVFTTTGLVTVYLFVVLFYPLICKNINLKDLKQLRLPHAGKKLKTAVFSGIIAVVMFGLFNFNCLYNVSKDWTCLLHRFNNNPESVDCIKLKFNDDIKDMYVPPKALAQAEKLYAKLTGRDFNYSFVTVKAENTQKLLEKEETISDVLDKQGYEYYALSRFVPSIQKQKQNFLLRQELYKNSLASYAEFLEPSDKKKLLQLPDSQDFLTPEKIDMTRLSDFVVSSKQEPDGHLRASVMLVNLVNAQIPQAVIKSIQNTGNAEVINLKKDISQKVKNCRQACLLLFVPALFALFLILALIYKPVNALKITAPSFIGALFALALAGIVFGSVNLFHVLAMFLITGFSIDYSIFRFNGLRGKNSASSEAAVLISCITSAFSFFLLSMTSFKLISSLGFVLCAGILSSYILSVLIISNPCEEQTDNA